VYKIKHGETHRVDIAPLVFSERSNQDKMNWKYLSGKESRSKEKYLCGNLFKADKFLKAVEKWEI
jgi:hypothetical protein